MYTPEIIAEMKDKFGADALDYMASGLTVEEATAKHDLKAQAQAAVSAQIAELKASHDAEMAKIKAEFEELKAKEPAVHTPAATTEPRDVNAEMKTAIKAKLDAGKSSEDAWHEVANEAPELHAEWCKARMGGLPTLAKLINA